MSLAYRPIFIKALTGLMLMALCVGWTPAQPAFAAPQIVTLNGAGSGRIFDGLGAASAGASSRLLIDYPEPARTQILDYLFKPNYGANLQHLKVEIGGDVDSTDGSEPSHMRSATDQNYNRGYEWWLMKEAKLRNPNIKLDALEWGAPSWFSGGFFSQDNINYIINFINGAKNTHNLTIDYVGIWNETGYNTTWIKNLKNALVANSLTTKLVAADQVNNWGIVTDMNADPALMAAVDVVGVHYVGYNSTPAAQATGKPLWSSEDGPWNGTWGGATTIAKMYNRNYISGKITKTQIWSPITSYYDILPLPGSGLMYANTPWSGNYNVQPGIWVTAHTTQFAQPGWQYIDSSSGFLTGGGSFVTLKSGANYSVVIETVDAGANQDVTFNLTGGLSTGTVNVWKTDSVNQFIQQASITPVGGSYTITLAPGSIYTLTTTTGQAKGGAVPPASSAFPFPYTDTFDGYATGKTAKYLSDINGTYETVSCAAGRAGICLRQAINQAPIAWHYAGPAEPASFAGSTGWSDYQVSADVLLEQAGDAKIIGRLSSQNQSSGDVSAYQLYVSNTGAWSLRRGNSVVLASGSVAAFSLNTWHSLKLIFNGTQIQGLIDGVTVATVTDSTYANGMAGLGVRSWTNAQFDNFQVSPLAGVNIVPQGQMTASTTNFAVGYEASKAIDGNTTSMWHTEWNPAAPLPQSITLALGGSYSVTKLRYLPRQDGNPNGTITSYTVEVSTNGTNFTQVASGAWANTANEKSASFTATSATHIRLTALAGTTNYASAAELNVEYATAGNPLPSTSGLSPSSATAGGAGFTLTVSGNNFINTSIVRWNGADRTTTFVSSSSLTASITAADIASAGTASVTVFNPTPGGGTSNPQTFTISSGGSGTIPQGQMSASASSQASGYEAAKSIDGNTGTMWHTPYSCSPSCVPTVALPQYVTLALGGSYSVNKVRYLPRQDPDLNGTITTYNIYISTNGTTFTQVASGSWAATTAEKSASFTAVSATHVRLEATAAHNGYASAAEINVEYSSGTNNPVPSTSGLSPSSATAGGAAFTLTVNGSNFINTSIVRWNGANRTTTFVSSSSLTASISAADIASAGTASVTVFNPTPGGGTSNAQTFTINAAGGTIPQSQMSATASSQHSGYEASKSIDGNTSTFWHTPFDPVTYAPTVALPQYVTLTLGGSYTVNKVRYLTRQDGNLNGTITSYKIYVSTNGSSFTQVATGTWANDFSEKSVSFTATAATHVRIEAVAAHNNYAAAAEIHVEY